jgi:16S rRNA processing protein RimM
MAAVWDEMLVVGRVARSHGNRGHVIVNPETDFADDRFRIGSIVYVRRPDRVEALELTAVRFQRGRPIVGLRGVETMNDAEALAGADLRVPSDALHTLPAGSFYRHDLVGCSVRTIGGREVGCVKGVEGPIQGSRLIVESTGGEVLVPMVEGICVRVDVAGRTIVIDPPDGLLELNGTGLTGTNRGV